MGNTKWPWTRLMDWLCEIEDQSDVRFLAVLAFFFAIVANLGIGCEQSERRIQAIRCGCEAHAE